MRTHSRNAARRWRYGWWMVAVACCALPGLAHSQGVFTQQIPIKLPKGVNGTQPELSLAYSSGGGNGMVGMVKSPSVCKSYSA